MQQVANDEARRVATSGTSSGEHDKCFCSMHVQYACTVVVSRVQFAYSVCMCSSQKGGAAFNVICGQSNSPSSLHADEVMVLWYLRLCYSG